MGDIHQVNGACHCGAVSVALTLSKLAAASTLHACQCSFCRSHGAITVSDPDGQAIISSGPGDLNRYRFGLSTADFLLCAHCGVYIAALIEDEGGAWATVNAGGLGMAEFAGRTAKPVSFSGETPEGRIMRRKAKWTPARLEVAPPMVAANAN